MAGQLIYIMELRQPIQLNQDGISNRKIPEMPGISRNTVNSYVRTFYCLSICSWKYYWRSKKDEIDGQTIQVYSPAKTIADCFKFRNEIGKEIVIDVLQSRLDQNSQQSVLI